MSQACLELCGAFASTERWQKAWELLKSGDCSTQELRISHNTEQQVLETCTALQDNSSVQELHVGALGEAGAGALSCLLQGSSGLVRLHISQLLGGAALGALVPGLAASSCQLQALTLSGLQPTALATLAAALAGSSGSHLTALTLSGCRFDGTSATALAAALAALPHLARLALPQASFQPSSSQGPVLAALLGAPLAAAGRLTALDMSSTPLTPGGAAALGTFLAAAPCLTHLTAADCQLGDEGAAALAQAAAAAAGQDGTAGQLQELVLDSNDLHTATCQTLATWATTTCSSSCSTTAGPWGQLRVLSLCSNALAGGDLVALAPGLAAAPALTEVRLAANKLTDVSPLATLLSSPSCHLTALDLSSNAVGDAGANALAAALAANTSLVRLGLSHTRVGDVGAAALAAVLAAHPGPWSALDLAHCRLRNTGLNALLDAALDNGGVLELGVEGHGATDRGLRTVATDVGRALAERRRKGPSRGSRRASTPASGDGAAANGSHAGGVAAGDDMHAANGPDLSFTPALASSAGVVEVQAATSWEGWGSSSSGDASIPPPVPPASQPGGGGAQQAVEAPAGAGSRRSSSSTAAGLDPAPAAKSPRLGEADAGVGAATADVVMTQVEDVAQGTGQPVLSPLPPHLALPHTRSISLNAWGRSASASSRASSATGANQGTLHYSVSNSSLSGSEGEPASPTPNTTHLLQGWEAYGPGAGAPADPLMLLPGLAPVWAQPSLDAWAAEAAASLSLGSPRPLARAGSSNAWAFAPLSRSGSGVGPGGKALVRAGSLVQLGTGTPPAAPGRDSGGLVAVARRRGSKGGAAASKGSRLAAMSSSAGGGLQLLGVVTPEPVSLTVYKARAAAAVGSRVKGGAYRPGPWGALAAAGGQLAPPAAPYAAGAEPQGPALPAVGVAARCAAVAALAPAVRGGACLSAAFLDDSEEALEALDL